MEKPSRSSRVIQKWLSNLYTVFEERSPKLHDICFNKDSQAYPGYRKAFSFLFGLLMGLFLYFLIISDLQLGKNYDLACGAIVVAVLSIGCAYSLQCRCVTLLSVPGFFSGAGRSALKAMVMGYLIAGPLLNLTYNVKEVMRCFACTTQLTYNLTKMKYDLMMAPFREAMEDLKENEEEIKQTINSVNELIEPIRQEIEGEDELEELNAENDALDDLEEEEAKEGSGQGGKKKKNHDDADAEDMVEDAKEKKKVERKKHYRSDEIHDKAELEEDEAADEGEYYEAKYREKITARCQYQLTKGSLKCREAFQGAYDKCYDLVTWVAGWILCWPMKLTFVCDLVLAIGGDQLCNPEGEIDPGVGQGYVALLETRNKLRKDFNSTDVKFHFEENKEIKQGVENAARVAHDMIQDFEVRKIILMKIFVLIKRFFSLVFLRIIVSASKYHANYLDDIEFDNVYVTSYFRRIDARRRARGSSTLLPLKKLERVKLIDPYSLRQSKNEKRDLIGQTAKLLLEIMTTLSFVFLDRVLYEVLDSVRNHGKLEITQKGHHDIVVEVYGTGMMASLIRTMVKSMNRKRTIHNFVTNEACLPRPNRVPGSIMFAIYFTYLIIWLMLFVQAYVMRTRPVIVGYFYRRRHKRRTLYLYNETLRRRAGFLKFARGRVLRLARARLLVPESRFWLWLRVKFPRWFGWLGRFRCARRTCSVCSEPEKYREDHHVCQSSGCFVVYCEECWIDVGEKCVTCVDTTGDTSSEEDFYDEDDYDPDHAETRR